MINGLLPFFIECKGKSRYIIQVGTNNTLGALYYVEQDHYYCRTVMLCAGY